MTLQSDLDSEINEVFLDSDDFADAVTYTPSGGSASPINGIFDKQYPAENERGSITFTPRILVASTDVAGIQKNDTFLISGTTYYVFEPEPDDNGMRNILLSEHQT